MHPSPSLFARIGRKLRLTTKMAPKRGGYYKGTGSGAMGWHTKHGGYRIDPAKVRTYVVPRELGSCGITPFVPKTVKAKKPLERLNGETYLNWWKRNNGVN